MVDVSLIPEAAWCEARRRAEVIRPLVSFAAASGLVGNGTVLTTSPRSRRELPMPNWGVF